MSAARVLNTTVYQILIEPRLIDGHNWPQAHRDRREFPKIGHQPRMRIARQPAHRLQLAAKMFEVLFAQAALEEGSRIHARRSMPLEINQVSAVTVFAATAEKVIEADFIERGRRSERRNVTTQSVKVLIRPMHHRHRVPANDALD